MAKTKNENEKDAATPEPLAASPSAALGGNRPAEAATEKRYRIYGDDGTTIIATTDHHLSAYGYVVKGRKVIDSNTGKPYTGGKAGGEAGGEAKKRGAAHFNVLTIVALLAMFFISFTLLSTLARGQTPKQMWTEVGVIDIPDLSKAKLVSGTHYRVSGTHRLSSTVSVPSDCSIDARDATIIYDGANPPVWSVFRKRNVTIFGGQYQLGQKNYVAFLEHGDTYRLSGATINGIGGAASGGLAIVRGSRDVIISDCSADTIAKYLIYAESGNRDLTLARLVLTRGSTDESGLRLCDSISVRIIDCEISATLNKRSALRMQDGADYEVTGGKFVGGFGAGPLADGDGGRNITDPVKRAQAINKRMEGVRVIGTQIVGGITLEAGTIDYRHTGGSVTNDKVFIGTTWRYPETDQLTQAGDIVRPQATGSLFNVTLNGDVSGNPVPLNWCVIDGQRVRTVAQSEQKTFLTFDSLTPSTLEVFRGTRRAYTDAGQGIRIGDQSTLQWWIGGWAGEKEKPDLDLLTKSMAAYPKRSLVIFDIEGQHIYDIRKVDADRFKKTVEMICGVLKTAKAARGDLQIGLYATLPVEYWSITNHFYAQEVKARADRGEPMSAADQWWLANVEKFRTEFVAWQKSAAAVAPIIAASDAVFPDLYLHYDIDGADDRRDIASDAMVIKAVIAEAKKLAGARPVYAYVSPYIHDYGVSDPKIRDARWRAAMEAIKAAGADGVVVWGWTRGQPLNEYEQSRMKIAAEVFAQPVIRRAA